MRKLLITSIAIVITGCATQPIPMPAPMPEKCIRIPGKGCQPVTAGNVGGTTLGHSDDEDLPAKASKP